MYKYLITSPEFYTDISDVFREKLSNQIQTHKPTYILYRDKLNPQYDTLAKEFIETCKEHKDTKSFLHQKVELAKSLNASGVHLTSMQFDEIKKAKSYGLEVIVSTHTHEEVLKAQELGADAVTYSPVFASPGKGTPKGIKDLENVVEKYDIKVFALGGIIDSSQINMINKIAVYGFASIRYFF